MTSGAIFEGFVPLEATDSYARHFGHVYSKSENSLVSLGFLVGPDHVNRTGACHGAALAFFADMQLFCVRGQLEALAARHTPTIELSLDYLSPVMLGSWVVLRAELMKATNTIAFTRATMTVTGTPVVSTHAKYRIYREKPPFPEGRPARTKRSPVAQA